MHRRATLVVLVTCLVAVAASLGATSPAKAAPLGEPLCIARSFMCTDLHRHTNYEGEYSGHDEPAIVFYSNQPGSGNRSTYQLTLPGDSAVLPTQDGTGGTWNFQLHPAFWFSMALCDNQSAPEFTHASCTPNTDANIHNNPDPSAPDWIGHMPGSALLELQFYPPGYASFLSSCSATQWCAAMTIDSLNFDDLRSIDNNKDCLVKVSDEPVNFAYITKTGVPHAPPSPLANATNTTEPAFTFNPSTDLVMNKGDRITIDIHDTSAGLTTILHDQTTGTTGSMTASVANGFKQVLFEPGNSKCHEAPYAFHPMFSTSTPDTRLEWTAHSLNIAYSDEIGHFEYCNHVTGGRRCTGGNATDPSHDSDDDFCIDSSESLLVKISGCISGFDADFDGVSYQSVWPGSGSAPARTSRPIRFTSPTFGGQQYSSVAFQTDLVVLQRAAGICTSDTLNKCTIPPGNAPFYPMYTTGNGPTGGCEWREGGPNIPGATNRFGGTPAAFWGPPVVSYYPTGVASTGTFFESFERRLANNPCLAPGS
jgi:hypothetical protein